ncbi:MAG: FtsX-like permease family protein [Candidatus Thorarchaeota archaeon]
MAKKKTEKAILKGNPLWSIGYAITSMKNYKVRNVGIALILAISVAIPTTIFAWTSTGSRLAVETYFDENAYQFSIQNDPASLDYSHLFDAQNLVMSSPYAEYAHITPSTVGIFRMDGTTPEWEEYFTFGQNYAQGVKDCRVIIVDNEILNVWSNELDFRGNTTLSPGEVLVSERFIELTEEMMQTTLGVSIDLDVGSEISLDVLRTYYSPAEGRPFDPLLLNRQIVRNLTIAGVYDVIRSSVVVQSYPSLFRPNYDPLGFSTSVLGIVDSVLMLPEELGPVSVEMITNTGFFSPVEFVRGSVDGLVKAGVLRAAQNLLNLKTQIEESDAILNVIGLDNIDSLQTHITTYIQSQVLIILAFPIMIMSLMLTIFTSETSVSQRKGEISALRAKGASFNQIFAAFIWESLFLSVLGLIAGLLITVLSAPLMGSSTGLLSFDQVRYTEFVTKMTIPGQALALSATIALFLPAAYLLHVARRIDVAEIGQPTTRMTYEIPEETNIWFYVITLGGTLVVLLIVPVLFNPAGQTAFIEILLSTGILFISSYLGSRAMRLVTANASENVGRLLGEKKLYMTQSLRRRKGQFIPLLVILTLTLTTTTMMLIQTASFEDTLENEALYALGCDIRLEVPEQPFAWTDTLEGFGGVVSATPVVESLSYVGTTAFYLEGIDAESYSTIGNFKASSFVSGTPEEVLAALEDTNNGIILSRVYSERWNLTTGDSVDIRVSGVTETSFEIVGIMKSAPGFGMASSRDLDGIPFGAYFEFQPGRGGFALVNYDFLASVDGVTTTEVFLVGTTSLEDASDLIAFASDIPYAVVYTTDSIEFGSDTVTGLFLAGIEGLTMIAFFMCAAMGIASIALFLGSAVMEREPEYALFRAIGGTKKQVVSLVFGEFAGSVLAAVLISLGLGVLFGYTLTLLTFGISSVWPILPKILTYPLIVMVFTVAIECVTMVAACYFPARRAGGTNPADVLRNM